MYKYDFPVDGDFIAFLISKARGGSIPFVLGSCHIGHVLLLCGFKMV